ELLGLQFAPEVARLAHEAFRAEPGAPKLDAFGGVERVAAGAAGSRLLAHARSIVVPPQDRYRKGGALWRGADRARLYRKRWFGEPLRTTRACRRAARRDGRWPRARRADRQCRRP